MFAFFEKLAGRLKFWLSWVFKGVALFIVVGLGILFFEWKGLPWLSSQAWSNRLGVGEALGERVTVIERRESVSITQDENIERMVAEHGSVVVGVLEETFPAPQSLTLALNQSRLTSGVWVTNDGFLVTYRERAPLAEQSRYTIFLTSGEAKEARVAGYDTLSNLLYLRVEGSNTPAIAFANSAELKPGRRVVFLSHTTDARLSAAPNVISSFERTFNLAPQTVAASEKWEGVFTLGSPIIEKSPGSPALLPNGELAGIFGEVRVDSTTRSFLIPANAVRESLDRLRGGRISRPTAGIYYLSITPALKETLGLSVDRGALIYSPSERTGLSVLSGSPAALANLQFGDIITSVNGAEVNLELPLSVALGRLNPGESAKLRILREGIEREVTLSL